MRVLRQQVQCREGEQGLSRAKALEDIPLCCRRHTGIDDHGRAACGHGGVSLKGDPGGGLTIRGGCAAKIGDHKA